MLTISSPAAPLHVAVVAPPYFDIPPKAYGGIEEVIAGLAGALIKRGHEVTLIAAGRNGTPARCLRTYAEPQPHRLGEPMPEMVHAAATARLLADLDVDVVHDHTLAGPLTAGGRVAPTVATMHGPVNGEMGAYLRHLQKAVSLVAISRSQRALAPDLNWIATVHNGIDLISFPYRETKEDFVLFLGRFHPHKGPELAIDAARAAGRPIVLAGKVNEPGEKEFFEQVIKPRLGDDAVYVGQADATLKRELFAKAACVLFPVRWPEPFGMVMIEAMACGTPIVALRNGSVPEVVAHGSTGIICDTPEQLPLAIEQATQLRSADCRAWVARHFDLATMAEGYEKAYRRLIASGVAREPVMQALTI
jgi:glycosyltransferase involved in cell wall biosynthesis